MQFNCDQLRVPLASNHFRTTQLIELDFNSTVIDDNSIQFYIQTKTTFVCMYVLHDSAESANASPDSDNCQDESKETPPRTQEER